MNDIGDYPLQVRIGRQELEYGREWVIGNNNSGRNFSGLAFDAIKASYDTDLYRVDAWFAKLADFTSPGTAALGLPGIPEKDGDIDLYGVYGTYKGIENLTIDGYWMYVRNADNTAGPFFGGSAGGFWDNTDDTITLHTVGGRVAGAWEVGDGMLDASGEIAFQFGDNGIADAGGDGGDYGGWAANIMGGYTFTNVQWTPRVEAEYAYFSGDDDAADNDLDSFVRLFSDVHYGELNVGGNLDGAMTNMHIIRVGASAVPVEKLTLRGDFYYFLLAEDDNDGLGITFGLPQDPALGSIDDAPGYELDLIADYQYTEDLNLRVGWAHFFADDAVEQSWGAGNDDDVDYVYAQATLVF